MNNIKCLLAACCALGFIAACEKKENNDEPSAKKQLISAGKWQMIAGTASTTYQGKDTTIDTFTPMEECEKDDFIIFGINGMATQDENQNKCPHDQQQESCPWYFVDGESRLALIDSNPDTFDVVELTSSQLIMELTRPNSSGIPVVSRHTYKNIN